MSSLLERSTDYSLEAEKGGGGGNWFSNIPKRIEGFQKTG